MLCHFSSGAGRSGAFLAMDANLELLHVSKQLDVFEYCKILNNSRPGLIESIAQYNFIYSALAEAVLCGIQPIAMHELKERSSMYKAKKDRQIMETQDSYENKVHTTLSS